MLVYKFLQGQGVNTYYTDAFVDSDTNKVLNNFVVTESRETSKDIISAGVNIHTGVMYTENEFIEMAKNGAITLVRSDDSKGEVILNAASHEGVTVTLKTPANDATDVAINAVKFTWDAVEGIAYYILSLTEGENTTKTDVGPAEAPELTMNGLKNATNYSWTVEAVFPDLGKVISDASSFTTVAA